MKTGPDQSGLVTEKATKEEKFEGMREQFIRIVELLIRETLYA